MIASEAHVCEMGKNVHNWQWWWHVRNDEHSEHEEKERGREKCRGVEEEREKKGDEEYGWMDISILYT